MQEPHIVILMSYSPWAEPKSLAQEPRSMSELLSDRVSWDTHPLHGHSVVPASRNAARAEPQLRLQPSRLPAAPLLTGKMLGKGEKSGLLHQDLASQGTLGTPG